MFAKEFRNVMIYLSAIALIIFLFAIAWFYFHNIAEYNLYYIFGINTADIVFSIALVWLFMYSIGAILIELLGDYLEDRKEDKKSE